MEKEPASADFSGDEQVDLGKAARLQRSREALASELAAYDAAVARDNAEALRSTVVDALGELTALYRDEELWAVARSTVAQAKFDEIVGSLSGFPESLPPLFDLFGYRVPPPPPAEELVRDAVATLQRAGGEYPSPDEVDDSRAELGALLERVAPLASADLAPPSWEVARAAAEMLPAIEAGTSVAIAAASGAIATVVATAALGAVTAGAGALAGVLIVGGVRKWRRKQAAHKFDAALDEYRQELTTNLLPAVQAAALYHLDEISYLLDDPGRDHDALIRIDLEGHLDEILGLARRFAGGDQHLLSQVKQAQTKGNVGPARLLEVLRSVKDLVNDAQLALRKWPPMDCQLLERLVAESARLRAIRLVQA